MAKAERESVVDRKKRLAKEAALRVIERGKLLREQLAPKPWRGDELAPEDSLKLYEMMMNDPAAMADLIQRDLKVFRLNNQPHIVITKRLWQEDVEMYAKAQEQAKKRTPVSARREEESDDNDY